MKLTSINDKGFQRIAGSLWNEYGGQNPGVDRLLNSLGFGPNGPPPARKSFCTQCGQTEVVVREIHADTDMNEMVYRCLNCRHEVVR